MSKETTRTLLLDFERFECFCASCCHCNGPQKVLEAGPHGETRMMIDCTEPEKCYHGPLLWSEGEFEYESFLARKEEAYMARPGGRNDKFDEWFDDPEWEIIWAYEQIGRTPYDEYEELVADADERRPLKSNCLFRA